MRLALLLMALLLTGCATAHKTPVADQAPVTSKENSIRGNAVVEFRNRETLRGRAVIMAKEPALFKILLLGPFGHTAWAMTGNTEYISIFRNSKSTTYTLQDENFPYRFSSQELVAYLMGKIPKKSTDRSRTMEYRTKRDKNGNLTDTVKYVNERPALKVHMADYRTVSKQSLPFLISITDADRSLEIRFIHLESNPAFNNTVFEIKRKQ